MPSGPTVTASGRQVRSRATGLYGETLHSGQVSDRASPATGDYVRSDVSEEPQQHPSHGRSTRAAGRGATNGGRLNRTVDSDEEDATSWDGGDEDEDEPDQMELDDDDDAHDEASSSEEEEEKSLMVTLRYGKGTVDQAQNANTNGVSTENTNATNGTSQQTNHTSGAPLAGHGAPRQPESHVPAAVEPTVSAPSASVLAPAEAVSNTIANGNAMVSEVPVSIAPVEQPTLPKQDGVSSTPIQPLSNSVPTHSQGFTAPIANGTHTLAPAQSQQQPPSIPTQQPQQQQSSFATAFPQQPPPPTTTAGN